MADAREYHDRTNHTPRSVAADDFRPDRSNQPRPYKRYENLPRRTVAEPVAPPPVPALSAVVEAGESTGGRQPAPAADRPGRPHPLLLRDSNHEGTGRRGPSDAVPRGLLHGEALPRRPVRGLWRLRRARHRGLSLRPLDRRLRRPPGGRLPGRPRRGGRRPTERRRGGGHLRRHLDVVARRLEVPRSDLSPRVLGLGDGPREPPRDRPRERPPGRGRRRVRRRSRGGTARRRPRGGGAPGTRSGRAGRPRARPARRRTDRPRGGAALGSGRRVPAPRRRPAAERAGGGRGRAVARPGRGAGLAGTRRRRCRWERRADRPRPGRPGDGLGPPRRRDDPAPGIAAGVRPRADQRAEVRDGPRPGAPGDPGGSPPRSGAWAGRWSPTV
jgi:hypothetical protein